MGGAANLSIGARLGGAFAIVLAAMAVLIGVAIVQVARIADIEERVMDQDWTKLEAARTIDALTRSNAARLLSLFIIDDKAEERRTLARVDENIATIKGSLETLDRLVASERGKQLVGEVREARRVFAESFNRVRILLERDQDKEAAQLVRAHIIPNIEKLQNTIQQLVQYQDQIVRDSRSESRRIVSSARELMIALGVAAMLVAALLAWWISRSITRPLARAVGFAQTVAEGDLRQHVDAAGTDETARLLQALEQMNGALVGIISEVAEGSASMLQASREIAQGSMELSARTESQASSLEETASSLEQLTVAVHQNADRARDVSRLVTSAADAAGDGGAAVERVIGTMAAIDRTAREVVGITAIIDAIAFQTNILALNAAVEAARAGESGRGFAVVAGEVRVLAQRAAKSAHEIKSLVDESIRQVEEGGRQVQDAGRTIARVVTQVRGVADTMSEIALASNEQSGGIEQINSAVTQMDHVTQQNAALVEETAAAAAALSRQAQQLERTAARFRLPGQEHAHVAPALAAPAPIARSPAPPLRLIAGGGA
ncbi:methyl-accepting chemotaxis protein [Herbaspirillum sp. WKF16]|uniref:methyl-accepting chemotaxis protein n=1 Tax=Herbaspirillum sp. WKF16 TaxID=3028312 RepID=UPI0023AA0C1A|nr:methyl-accepting chemotaxis protein [Herbaspirillum sp. WKF16]WDZ95872.1 methyl-accepting chemotaxis protein [Herbaspirillum sp. WKF16]